MSDEEVIEIMVMLVKMTEEKFKKFTEYIENTKMHEGTREFFQLAIKIADKKRQSLTA